MLTGKDTQWLKGYLPTNVNTNNTSGKKRVTKNSYGNKTKQKSKIHSKNDCHNFSHKFKTETKPFGPEWYSLPNDEFFILIRAIKRFHNIMDYKNMFIHFLNHSIMVLLQM